MLATVADANDSGIGVTKSGYTYCLTKAKEVEYIETTGVPTGFFAYLGIDNARISIPDAAVVH